LINVTKTYLPDIDKYKKYIDEIYETGRVTNRGPLVDKLEKRLEKYLGVKNLILVSSGTDALKIAYRALEIKGEAITTPFSFVATTSSLVTNGIKPIFADIKKDTLNIDPKNIEKAITKETSAIVPVHVFGSVCEVEEIERIASQNNLKIIYDAAHAFGVKFKGESVLKRGDISILSFHATKIFHTIEGGALIVNDDSLVDKVRYLINFGIKDETTILELGTNSKMNEFEAAMGMCVLDEMENISHRRKAAWEYYERKLRGLVEFQKRGDNETQNYGYFPILLKNERQVVDLMEALNKKYIFPRRYFSPSLDTLPYIEPKQTMNISRSISKRVLVLPLSAELTKSEQKIIIKIITGVLIEEA